MANKYYRVRPGNSIQQERECLEKGFVGLNYGINRDLSAYLYMKQLPFREKFAPEYYMKYSNLTMADARSAMSKLWYFCCNLEIDDTIISYFSDGLIRVGIVSSPYFYVPDSSIPHRRSVDWIDITLDANEMTASLRPHVLGKLYVCANLSDYSEELDRLIEEAMNKAGLEFC